MAKDILEKTTEPDLNIKAYLADAYLHPIFQSFEVEEELVEVRVDKQVATSPLSEISSSSPQHVHQSSPPHYNDNPTSSPPAAYFYRSPSPPHYVYHYQVEP